MIFHVQCSPATVVGICCVSVSTVNMVLNVHRNHKAIREGGMEVGGKGDYIPIATLSQPE